MLLRTNLSEDETFSFNWRLYRVCNALAFPDCYFWSQRRSSSTTVDKWSLLVHWTSMIDLSWRLSWNFELVSFISLEQSDYNRVYNSMVDMWAFGCTFYEILHVAAMFSGPLLIVARKTENHELRAFTAECPKEFKNAIMQCFEVDPNSRPDAFEFMETVESIRFNLKRSKNQR